MPALKSLTVALVVAAAVGVSSAPLAAAQAPTVTSTETVVVTETATATVTEIQSETLPESTAPPPPVTTSELVEGTQLPEWTLEPTAVPRPNSAAGVTAGAAIAVVCAAIGLATL